MDKQYNPIEVEEKWVKIWSKRKNWCKNRSISP